VAGCCEHCNKPVGDTNAGNFFYWPVNFYLPGTTLLQGVGCLVGTEGRGMVLLILRLQC
jgi:hypothetical protein